MHKPQTSLSAKLSQFLPAPEDGGPIEVLLDSNANASFHILLVEGNLSLAKLLATGLRAEAYVVTVVHEAPDAFEKMSANEYGLIVVDLNVPAGGSAAIVRQMRQEQAEARILVMGQQSGSSVVVSMLEQGADDYLPKPFSLLEFLARVQVFQRRSGPSTKRPRATGPTLNREESTAEWQGRSVELTPREFALLEFLMQNEGKTLSRALLMEQIWNMSADADTNIVDVYIKYLRDKLERDGQERLIKTVRGVGYIFKME